MKLKLTTLAVLLASAAITSNCFAQKHKMILNFPPMNEGQPARTQGYFVDRIDSIKFEEGEFDMGFEVDFKHVNRGNGKLSVKKGLHIAQWKMHVMEEWKVKRVPDAGIVEGLLKRDPKIQSRFDNLENADLSGLHRGERYQVLAYGTDSDNTEGELVRYSFEVPDFPLLGNPKLDVEVKDLGTSSFKVSIKPNEDVSGYYFICDTRANGDESYKQTPWGEFPSMKTYLMVIGGDFRTRQAHKGETIDFQYDGFLPNTLYGLYMVLLDKEGQPSDLIVHDIKTLNKGTNKPSVPKLEILEVTDNSISARAEADENTSVFRLFCVEKEVFDKDTEGMLKYIKDTPDTVGFSWQAEKDEAMWHELKADTEYYVIAWGKNAEGKMGEPVKVVVRTKKGSGATNTQPSVNQGPVMARMTNGASITIK